MKILLVEDDGYVRDGLSIALRTRAQLVETASNYQEAIDALNAQQFDVLVCDWQLGDPAGDGVGVARHAKKTGVQSILMVTARDLDDLKGTSADVPIKAYLRKPVAIADLISAIEA
ncbi:MAG: response regulator [Gammaproteobacteria bacterium]|nr:response regulator [Gammaproteobacteria bacterium]